MHNPYPESDISWKCPNCGAEHFDLEITIRGMVEIITSSSYLRKISREERRPIDEGWKTREEVKKWSGVSGKRLSCTNCFRIILNGPLYSEIIFFLQKNPVPPPPAPPPDPYFGHPRPFVPLTGEDV